MDGRSIRPRRKPVDAVFQAVPSKSVTHRALVAAGLATGASVVRRPLEADDTRITRDGLARLGVEIRSSPNRWAIEGCGGRLPGGGSLFLGESGTSMRFLTAVAALGATPSVLDGAPRLRERPMRELAVALQTLGGSVELAADRPGLPLRAGGIEARGGAVRVRAARSSQFASALLLIAPRLPEGVELTLEPPAVSLPYVDVTARVLSEFGVQVEHEAPLSWRVGPQDYAGREYTVEGDHSSASYFLAAAALLGGRVRMLGLRPQSAQADARFCGILQDMGCGVDSGEDWIEVQGHGEVTPFDLDMGEAPDLVPTMAVLALFASGPCVMRGVAHLRHKESDRLEVLAENLRRLGRDAIAEEDRLVVGPAPARLHGTTVVTASDHRMAMAFAVAGLRLKGVSVDDAGCVAKSNPDFWQQFAGLEP
jgi:3-phosphoshikimate 1-carboxyvinyltransferase